MERAILAGGCFWGMEDLFRHLPGVVSTCVGYCGGDFPNPTYNDVKTGKTGHAEAIEIVFDPAETDFKTVLALFFRIHDPTTLNRQGNDIGSQYRSAIFYLNEGQKKIAEDYINAINASGKWPGRVVTELKSAGKFYQAEEYHQNYLQRYPEGYNCHWARPDWLV